MRTATAVVRAGVCGFTTRVRAEGDDDFTVRLAIVAPVHIELATEG